MQSDLLEQEVQNPETAMPPVTDFIPKGKLPWVVFLTAQLIFWTEDGDDSEDEDDVQVGGVTQDYKCPITLRPLTDPLTS